MKKNRTLPTKEFSPSNEKITTKKLGIAIYRMSNIKAAEKMNATMAAVMHIFFFAIIFYTITKISQSITSWQKSYQLKHTDPEKLHLILEFCALFFFVYLKNNYCQFSKDSQKEKTEAQIIYDFIQMYMFPSIMICTSIKSINHTFLFWLCSRRNCPK